MFHVGIIMDGNGRWAERRKLPRLFGHRQGARALRRVIGAASGLDITDLSVYAFSSDNWKRPAAEVAGLLGLMRDFIAAETERLVEAGVRISFIGRRDRLPAALRAAMLGAETATVKQRRLHVRVAVDYSAREAIVEAAQSKPRTREAVSALLPAPDVDLLIRTAGERRLSDFLLWECAYAELWFTEKAWPEFSAADLAEAVGGFSRRVRRFGALPA